MLTGFPQEIRYTMGKFMLYMEGDRATEGDGGLKSKFRIFRVQTSRIDDRARGRA